MVLNCHYAEGQGRMVTLKTGMYDAPLGISKDYSPAYSSTPPLPYTDSYFPFAGFAWWLLVHLSLLVPKVSFYLAIY